MNDGTVAIIIIAIFIFIGYGIYLLIDYSSNPFPPIPVVAHSINLSGRRNASYNDFIQQWMITNAGYDYKQARIHAIKQWDAECQRVRYDIKFFRKHKLELLAEMQEVVYDSKYPIFEWQFYRVQTRYKQVQYQRTAYKVDNVENIITMNIHEVLELDYNLRSIGYETTLEKYYAKNQRKLMTKELRFRVMRRDNYTCRMCGKYMPDQVGLHIDHIIPVKRGGKTIESNLQVLCDKCNYRKGTKPIYPIDMRREASL